LIATATYESQMVAHTQRKKPLPEFPTPREMMPASVFHPQSTGWATITEIDELSLLHTS
jgi:hypothetical protein